MRVSFAGTEDFVLSLSERLEWKWVGNLEERLSSGVFYV